MGCGLNAIAQGLSSAAGDCKIFCHFFARFFSCGTIATMKKPTPQVLAGQQKLFSLLSGPTRLRIVQQLVMTPHATLEQLIKRTGIAQATAAKALRDLLGAKVVSKSEAKEYSVSEKLKLELEDIFVDSAYLAQLLNKTKLPKAQKQSVLSVVS